MQQAPWRPCSWPFRSSGYLLGALRKHRVEWVSSVHPARFPLNETLLETFHNPLGQPWDGMAARTGVYVRESGREARRFLVFAMNCAHLGCPVTWFPQSGLFMCPCHGGVYYENGERASRTADAGPVPVRLEDPRRPARDPGAALAHVAEHSGPTCESVRTAMKRILAWLEARLSLRDTVGPMLMHPDPRGAAGPMGWWYVFGSASMTLLFIQILSGIGLALVYVPTADQAYESLVYLNYQQPLGWFLRSLHYWSGSAMVCMVVVHMTQVFLHAAFKYPRELNWLTGVLLLLYAWAWRSPGQVLRWDADAYWGVGVGASMAGRVPVVGPTSSICCWAVLSSAATR